MMCACQKLCWKCKGADRALLQQSRPLPVARMHEGEAGERLPQQLLHEGLPPLQPVAVKRAEEATAALAPLRCRLRVLRRTRGAVVPKNQPLRMQRKLSALGRLVHAGSS